MSSLPAIPKRNSRRKKANPKLERSLQILGFNPLKVLIEDVYPMLAPDDKAKVLFKLMDFLFAKPKPVDTQTGRPPAVQTNIQVNVPKELQKLTNSEEARLDIVKLLEAAEEKKEK